MSFINFNLDPRLLKNVQALGFEQPTPIQSATIPTALTGQDVLGSAETGTGKTAAYLLPIMQRLLNGPRPRGPRVLVLVPTRELALQVDEQARALSAHTGLRSVAVYGGVSLGNQEAALRRVPDIVIATPGRLLDHMERKNVRFDDLQVLVLDEADRMLDIGFLPDIRRVVKVLPKERQTLLFSATLQPIINLAYEVTRKAARIEVEKTVTPTAISQAFYPVPEHLKMQLLKQLLQDPSMDSVLIFSRTFRTSCWRDKNCSTRRSLALRSKISRISCFSSTWTSRWEVMRSAICPGSVTLSTSVEASLGSSGISLKTRFATSLRLSIRASSSALEPGGSDSTCTLAVMNGSCDTVSRIRTRESPCRMTEKLSLASLITLRMRAAQPTVYRSAAPGFSVRASRCVTIPMIGFSLAMASSTSLTDFLRPTSMGMIEPGNRTELRSGRTAMVSGISMGPSEPGFLVAITRIVVRAEPRRDKFYSYQMRSKKRMRLSGRCSPRHYLSRRRLPPLPELFMKGHLSTYRPTYRPTYRRFSAMGALG